MPTEAPRPTLTFAGNCAFCRKWVDFWHSLTGDRVDYRASTAPLRSVEYETPDARFIGADMRVQPVMVMPETHIQQILEYYMGKNTQERQEFIINNLKIELDLVEETPAAGL